MKLMWRYTMRHKKMLFFNFISVFGFIMIELGLPTLLARMIDEGVAKQDFAYVQKMALWMLGIIVVGITLHIFLTFFGAKLTTSIIIDVRDDMFAAIQTYSHQEYEKIGVSSLITRVTNDAYQVMLFLGQILRVGFMTPLMFMSSLYLIMRESVSLSRFIFYGIPLLLIGVIALGLISEPLSKWQQKNLDKINLILRENLSGLRVIRAFVNEKFQEKRFKEVNEAYAMSSTRLFKLVALAQPAFYFLFNIILIFVVWTGAKEIQLGTLELGKLISFIEYVFHALFSFMMFASVFMMYPRAAVSANRIQEVLATKTTIDPNPTGVTTTATAGVIEFKNVTFAYPGASESPVIRNVSFTAQPGETVAFIGSTGSGKSTLIQLLPRFYDVSAGEILIDGVNVKDYQLAALRQKIGYIPQKALLFSGTIRENLLFGKPDATEAELAYALDVAQGTEFVSQKPLGFEEMLAEGGSNFSGGQKQRLAIARALIRRPEIYVFDDSFSALDYKTDATLRQRLRGETTASTVLIVAQRVSTIMQADKIIVLNEGDIVGMGTHRELLADCEIYYDIASSQLTEEELA